MSNIKDVCFKLVSVKWSIASWMSSKLEPVIWLRVLVTFAYMKGRTDVRTYLRTLYVCTDVHDVMAITPNFLTSMGYHIFLTMVLRARAFGARGAPLLMFATTYDTQQYRYYNLDSPFFKSLFQLHFSELDLVSDAHSLCCSTCGLAVTRNSECVFISRSY